MNLHTQFEHFKQSKCFYFGSKHLESSVSKLVAKPRNSIVASSFLSSYIFSILEIRCAGNLCQKFVMFVFIYVWLYLSRALCSRGFVCSKLGNAASFGWDVKAMFWWKTSQFGAFLMILCFIILLGTRQCQIIWANKKQ